MWSSYQETHVGQQKSFQISFSSARKIVGKDCCFLSHENAEKNEAKDACFPTMDVNFSWNLPLEVFDCFKVVALAPVTGGVVVSDTRIWERVSFSHWQINIEEEQSMNDILLKKEKRWFL